MVYTVSGKFFHREEQLQIKAHGTVLCLKFIIGLSEKGEVFIDTLF